MKRIINNAKKGGTRGTVLAALTLLIAVCVVLTGIPVRAEDVPAEEIARIITRGYDLSDFTVIDDTDELVIISDMAETVDSIHLCGQAHFRGEIGSMTLNFEGNAVGVLAEKGGFEIMIDDESFGTVWTSSAGAPQVIFYTETLENTEHTITVITDPELSTEKIGERYSVLEGFFIQSVPGTGSATGGDPDFDPEKQDVPAEERAKIDSGEYDLTDFRIVDDTAPGVVSKGMSVTENAAHLCGNANFTSGTGSLTYTFEGNAIGVLAEKGGFVIEIDGENMGQFGAAYTGQPQVIFYTGTLKHGTHTIKVTTDPNVAKEYTGESWSVPEGFFVQKEAGKGSADGAPVPPTEVPTEAPTEAPTEVPTEVPTKAPTEAPTEAPTAITTEAPAAASTDKPAGTAKSKDTSGGNDFSKLLPFIIMGAVVLAAVVVIVMILVKRKRSS